MALFQNYDQRIGTVEAFLNMYGISSLSEAGKICADAGIDVFSIVRGRGAEKRCEDGRGDRPDPWRRPAELLHPGFRFR